jgi:hypothetical protein
MSELRVKSAEEKQKLEARVKQLQDQMSQV